MGAGGAGGAKRDANCPPLGPGMMEVVSPQAGRVTSTRTRLVKGKTVFQRLGTRVIPSTSMGGSSSSRRGRMSLGTLNVDSSEETPHAREPTQGHKSPFRNGSLANIGRRVVSFGGKRRSGAGLGSSPGDGARGMGGFGAGTPAGAAGRGTLGGGDGGDGLTPQRGASAAADRGTLGAGPGEVGAASVASVGDCELGVIHEGSRLDGAASADGAVLAAGKSGVDGGVGGGHGGEGCDGNAPPRKVTDLAAEFDRREHTRRLEEDAAVDAAAAGRGGVTARKRLSGAPGAAGLASTVLSPASVSSGGQPGGGDGLGSSAGAASPSPIREEVPRLGVPGDVAGEGPTSPEQAAAAAAAIRDLIDRFELVDLATTRAKEMEMQAATDLAASALAARGGGSTADADALAAGLVDSQAAAVAASATAAAVSPVAAGTPVDVAAGTTPAAGAAGVPLAAGVSLDVVAAPPATVAVSLPAAAVPVAASAVPAASSAVPAAASTDGAVEGVVAVPPPPADAAAAAVEAPPVAVTGSAIRPTAVAARRGPSLESRPASSPPPPPPPPPPTAAS